ncbi:glycoside hydrolase family 32 protein [Rothia sp. LK2588]|uniref:glycoside hydrolase family 32 protein n=1 Tax=Rothia sp. LK2588 TaxID=3114369 RepID=UPI0034D02035
MGLEESFNADLVQQAEENIQTWGNRVSADPDYPALHLAPPVGRLNDPNGLVYSRGVYHAFYQYSPVHPTRAVFWRHATSTDLTHWRDEQTVISPVRWYDRNGCYSGSGVATPEGALEFFYTGNVKDDQGNRETYQNLFISEDGGASFEVSPLNPLISGPEEGYTAHYRDPHVFFRNGQWWAVLGVQRTDETGAIVYYTSDDRRIWRFGGELEFSDPRMQHLGYMFECPNLIQLKDEETGCLKDVLIFCPQGMQPEGELYNNVFQCGYVVGTLHGNFFDVETTFTELDAGFEFYAPQVISGLDNATESATLMAWMGNAAEDDQPSWANHWVHMLTYPRAITLRGGRIYQRPVPQLEQALRIAPSTINSVGELDIPAGQRTFRLQARISVSAGPVSIQVIDAEGVSCTLTVKESAVELDRSGTRYLTAGLIRRRTLSPSSEHTIDLLFDASALEVFIDDGAVALTGRIYLHGELASVRFVTGNQSSAAQAVTELNLSLPAEGNPTT